MKYFFLLVTATVALSLFFIPQTAWASCCVCGGFGNPGSYLVDNVANCDSCSSTTDNLYVDNCPESFKETYQHSGTTAGESNDCCVMRQKIGGQVDTCWTNYPYSYCTQPKAGEFSTVNPEWKTQSCSSYAECKNKVQDYSTAPVNAPAEEKKPLVSFIPQITIPFSGQFNRGQAVVLTGNTLGEYIGALYIFFVIVAGVLATVMSMYGGLRYVMSGGNPQRIAAAKDHVISALVGLALVLGSYTIFLTINPNILKFTGLTEQITKIPGEKLSSYESQQLPEKPSVAYWDGNNVSRYDKELRAAAAKYGVRIEHLKAIMLVESSGNPEATSPAGACGLMQLLPSTANLTCEQLKDPKVNIDRGAQYFRKLLDNTCPFSATYKSGRKAECRPETTKCRDGMEHYAIAAYNGGVGANCSSITCPGMTWWECPQNNGFAETRAYVTKVESAYNKVLTDPDFAWTF